MTDLERKRGDTFADEFVIVSKATRLPVDITGYTFLLTVDPSATPANGDNNLFQLTGVLADPENGLVTFSPSVVQSDQTPAIYYYDIQMTDSVGGFRTVDSGEYEITQDITK